MPSSIVCTHVHHAFLRCALACVTEVSIPALPCQYAAHRLNSKVERLHYHAFHVQRYAGMQHKLPL